MPRLLLLSDVSLDPAETTYDPTGSPAFAADGQRVGAVRDALVDETSLRVRYLVVDVGGFLSNKLVLVPVGLARIGDHEVYFDTLSRDDVSEMRPYHRGEEVTEENRAADDAALRRGDFAAPVDTGSAGTPDPLFATPQRLQLLEERLVVNKRRAVAGSVEIGKHVETREQNVNVDLSHDEAVIERRPVEGGRPVEGNVTLGAGSETLRIDLEAERANVRKQAYVAEEVEIGKRAVSETRTFSDTVGRETLEVRDLGGAQADRANPGAPTAP
ncbi:PRC and DUF2382 domain-containing protein, partial [Deinococcus pimensis]|uniref:PRC and DUF2382 domain-containing protein n=1 Tax=Deinococcus pimensis TaxID=309888 RepID=UPI000694FD5C